MKGKVTCPNCGWSWNKSESSEKDMHVCHNCGKSDVNMKNGGWLDQYADGGTMQEHQENYNNNSVSLPEGFVGMGNNIKGRNYSPAWGGQFKEGGKVDPPRRKVIAESTGVYKKPFNEKELKNIIKDDVEYRRTGTLKKPRAEANKFEKYLPTKETVDFFKNLKNDNTSAVFNEALKIQHERGNPSINVGTDKGLPFANKRNYNPFTNEVNIPKSEYRGNINNYIQEVSHAAQPLSEVIPRFLTNDIPGYIKAYTSEGDIHHNIHKYVYNNPNTVENYTHKKIQPELSKRIHRVYSFPMTEEEEAEDIELFRKYQLKPNYQIGGNVYPVNYVPQAQMGMSMPGATGSMYARVGAPSNGPYAKKTMASAQNGQEMKYYQEGLDWQPKTISQNGYTTGDKVEYGTPEYREAYNRGEVITDEGVRSPIALDEVVIQNNYKRPRGFLEQYADKIAEENKDAGVLGAIIGTPISAITSLPQLAMMKGLTGEMQRPSEAMDIENPYGAFAVDAITDPTNLVGAGILTKEEVLAKLGDLRNVNAEGKIFSGMNNELNNMAIQNTERYMAKRTPSNVPLSKELEPYISRIGEPSISREEEVFRNVMGHDYRVAKELENTKFLDPDGNLINSDVKQNNFGSIYTLNPLTLFGDDFNKPFLRKIGNSKGIKSLIENEAITSPGYSAPYFSPKTTWEGYNGTFAVGVDPKKVSPRFNKNIKSFDKLGNKTKGGPESLSMYNKSTGDLQRGYQSSWKEIPLEEGATSIYRRLPFTGAYKEIPLNSVLNPSERTFAQKIALNPHLADAQNIAEQALRYGIKLSVAQEIANSIFGNKDNPTPLGNPIIPIKPVINKFSNKKKEGGIIKDDRGQWDHPGEITEIGSNDITMEGVPYDVLGISDTGDTKLMKPGKNYKFKGKKVTEFPMAKNGLRQEQKGLVNLDNLLNFTNYNKPQPGGWLDSYK